jgi:hypothetical protein
MRQHINKHETRTLVKVLNRIVKIDEGYRYLGAYIWLTWLLSPFCMHAKYALPSIYTKQIVFKTFASGSISKFHLSEPFLSSIWASFLTSLCALVIDSIHYRILHFVLYTWLLGSLHWCSQFGNQNWYLCLIYCLPWKRV